MGLVQEQTKLVVFPLLANVDTYNPNTFDYSPPADSALPKRSEWIAVWRASTAEFSKRCLNDASVPNAEALAEEWERRWLKALDDLAPVPADDPPPDRRLSCLYLCALRERLLRELGFGDCFAAVKAAENAAALQLLPGLLAELDGISDEKERLSTVIQGAFAGNIFDLGAPATQEMFAAGGLCFHATRKRLQPRPWTVDHFDALWERWGSRPYRSAVVFVDNAGADFVLGMVPLVRELLRRGARVVVAANELPAINDMTYPEAAEVLRAAGEADAPLRDALADGRLACVSSGNDLPVMDLRRVSPGLAERAAGCDLVVLEGMGRSIETNLWAEMTTADCLNLGMIKHQEVATTLGGPMYGCVCRFQRALVPDS